jgi:DNA-binding NtrC family response regulator
MRTRFEPWARRVRGTQAPAQEATGDDPTGAQGAASPPEAAPLPGRETVVLVEDDASFRERLDAVLSAAGYRTHPCADAAEALEVLGREDADVVVTDLMMPGLKGDALLARVRADFPGLPVIAITAFGTVESALQLTRAGAADYLTKPLRTQTLLDAVAGVLERTRPAREQARLRRGQGEHLEGLVGASPPMHALFDRIGRVAASPAPVLITGETGSGKELVARAVHRASGRGAFVAVNCGAIPEHLLESELFGHVRGAFTGAARDKTGLFQAGHGGTLFLDEIGELPLLLQPKLLRAIELREVRRVGEIEPRAVDVRVVAATHRDLRSSVAAGSFREDLFWRLNVLHLEVPPLRDRGGDVELLADAFLERIAARTGTEPLRLGAAVRDALRRYAWPGNVRQLLNVLERAAAFVNGPEIAGRDLPEELRDAAHAAGFVEAAVRQSLTLAEMEAAYITEVLRRAGGNKKRTAELLGIPRRTLYRRLEEYGIGSGVEPADFGPDRRSRSG